jgi:hypothetical protein
LKSLLTILALSTIATAASAATVWTAPAATKVRPTVLPPVPAPASAALSAARNEFESFHVVVTGQAAGVSMSLDGLSDGNGNTISGRDVVLYREALLDVAIPSGGDGQAGWWPDALIPDVDPIVGEKRNAFPFDVPAGESRAVLVDVHVPTGIPAGNYTGTLHVTGGVTADVPVTLTIWDFDLPSTASLKSAFGLAWNGPCLGHGDGQCSNIGAEEQLRARYIQAALDNRISISTPAMAGPVSASGSEDWSAFDHNIGPFLDGTAGTRLQGAKLTAVQIQPPQGSSSASQVKAYSQHFKDKGWTSLLFNYVCDEPPLTCSWSELPGRIAESRAGDPSVPTLVTTTTASAQQNGVTGIDLFTPVVNFMEDRPGTPLAGSQRSQYPADTWWYQSCMSFGCAGVGGGYDAVNLSGWPSYAVDTDGTRNRAMEWLSFTFNMSGEVYYETTTAYFGGDPWTQQYYFGGTGDGTLFYPGTPARIGGQTEIPVESLRLKGARDGMEDYELLALAKKLGKGDEALAIAQAVYAHTYEATTTPQKLDDARARLAQLILGAMGKLPTSPAPAPQTTPASAASITGDTAKEVGASGCATSNARGAWLALPLIAMFLRRRRAAHTSR